MISYLQTSGFLGLLKALDFIPIWLTRPIEALKDDKPVESWPGVNIVGSRG
jgi:hypothetical protein